MAVTTGSVATNWIGVDDVNTLPAPRKICSKCSSKKPHSAFYVQDKRTGRLDGTCKACRISGASEWIKANRQKHGEYVRAWRKRNPERSQEISRRSVEKNRDRINARERAMYAEKRQAKKAAYRAANREHIKARNAKYRKRNAAKIAAYNSGYYLANSEAVNARIKRAQAANPGLYNQLHKAAKHRRKVRLTNNGPSERFTDLEIFERDNWRCQLCGGAVDRTLPYPNPMSASLDHVLPIARGGGHTRKNAQLAHLGCNSRKRDRAA